MVKYSSRVGKGLTKRAPVARAKRTETREKVLKELVKPEQASVGGAGGSVIGLASRKEIVPASLSKGASLSSGGTLQTGGSLSSGGTLQTGGSLSSGGSIKSNLSSFNNARNFVQSLDHGAMGNVIAHMSLPDFSILQGLASASVGGVSHPMKNHIRKSLGGSFTHPKNVSRMATKDILKGNQIQIMNALHQEYLDKMSNRQVGGGLLDSIKHHMIRGLKGFNSKLSSGIKLAKQFESVLKKASLFAKNIAPSIKSAFPAQAGLIDAGVSGLSSIEKGISKGLDVAEKAQTVGQVSEGFVQAAV